MKIYQLRIRDDNGVVYQHWLYAKKVDAMLHRAELVRSGDWQGFEILVIEEEVLFEYKEEAT